MDQSVSEHYGRLMLLPSPWQVQVVKEDLRGALLEAVIAWPKGAPATCSVCGKECPVYDHVQERSWRHLSVLQYQLLLRCAVPRCHCPEHGIKMIQVPWAERGARFTVMFEKFALAVILAARSLTQAGILLKLDWGTIQRIIDRAVLRGIARRSLDGLVNLGLDEKSFLKGQDYVSLMVDLDGHRVLEVVKGHTAQDATELLESLPEAERERIKAVAIDMSGGFAKAVTEVLPKADIVYDRFHVSKILNEAVDYTRRVEAAELKKEGDESLKNTRHLWRWRDVPEALKQRFEDLLEENHHTGLAWVLKEQFVEFWSQNSREEGKQFLDHWVAEAMKGTVTKMKKVAGTILKHEKGLLNYFAHRISNAMCEGFNSAVQAIKSAARGFKNFANYRARILFFCGKLKLMPSQ